MKKRFFRLYDDVYILRRWHLDIPKDSQGRNVDDWEFKTGTPISVMGYLRRVWISY